MGGWERGHRREGEGADRKAREPEPGREGRRNTTEGAPCAANSAGSCSLTEGGDLASALKTADPCVAAADACPAD